MTTNDTYTLLSLLPSTSYALSYALPLFFVSLLLTFTGCFLTLDRTRTFAPSSVPPSAPRSKRVCAQLLPDKCSALLEGGVGGMASGYGFGGMPCPVCLMISFDLSGQCTFPRSLR